jgi:hypothetical protein
MEISLTPVMVMVIDSLSSPRAGNARIKANIMAATILVISAFIYISRFDETLLTVLVRSFSDKSTTVKCYNPPQPLSSPYRLTVGAPHDTLGIPLPLPGLTKPGGKLVFLKFHTIIT